jgi:hypothetical protein
MNTSYSIEITVAASPDEILATIHNPRSWWSEGITGSAGAAGDEFDYRYGTVHYCRVRIAESGPQRVVWEILENEFGVVDGEDEWVGTRCVFDLVPGRGSTVLRFTHDGLYPHFSCYDVCSQGWDHYIGSSLAAALTDGGTQRGAHRPDRLRGVRQIGRMRNHARLKLGSRASAAPRRLAAV